MTNYKTSVATHVLQEQQPFWRRVRRQKEWVMGVRNFTTPTVYYQNQLKMLNTKIRKNVVQNSCFPVSLH